ncbi:MAG: methionine adenosyltransferase [Archaeoglobaceae archaeon]
MLYTNSLFVQELSKTPIEKLPVEMVERKGWGHPDTLADGIAESISTGLSNYYLRNYGRILHYNTDQVQIVAGGVEVGFGGGRLLNPIHVIISGRATSEVQGESVPIHELAIGVGKEYLRKTLHHTDVENNFTFESKIGRGSIELQGLYDKGIPKANDTSIGVSYAPLSQTERLVIEVEKLLSSASFKQDYTELGEDIKVMAGRTEDKVNLTIAVAFVAGEVPDLDHYISVKEEVKNRLLDLAARYTSRDVSIGINMADDYRNEVVYLTLTGTSAEAGDDGSVGRGNRVNGLITPYRPMSLEAAAGKNSLAHVGKIYNLLAFLLAQDIYDTGKVEEVYVNLLSQIGKPIDQPQAVDIGFINNSSSLADLRNEMEGIVSERLENIQEITQKLLNGELTVF